MINDNTKINQNLPKGLQAINITEQLNSTNFSDNSNLKYSVNPIPTHKLKMAEIADMFIPDTISSSIVNIKLIDPNNIKESIGKASTNFPLDTATVLKVTVNALETIISSPEIQKKPTALYLISFVKMQLESLKGISSSMAAQSDLLSIQDDKLMNLSAVLNKVIDDQTRRINEAKEQAARMSGWLSIFSGLALTILGIMTEDPLLMVTGITQLVAGIACEFDPNNEIAQKIGRNGVFAVFGENAAIVQTVTFALLGASMLGKEFIKDIEELSVKFSSKLLLKSLNEATMLVGISYQCIEIFKKDPEQNGWLVACSAGIMGIAVHGILKVPELREQVGESNVMYLEAGLDLLLNIALQVALTKNNKSSGDFDEASRVAALEQRIEQGIERLASQSLILRKIIQMVGGTKRYLMDIIGINLITGSLFNALKSYENYGVSLSKAQQAYDSENIDILLDMVETNKNHLLQVIEQTSGHEQNISAQSSDLFSALSKLMTDMVQMATLRKTA
jgi:hypothetical protein